MRAGLDRCGYTLVKPDYARFGLSLYPDLARIGRDWDWTIDTVFDIGANVGQFSGMTREPLPGAHRSSPSNPSPPPSLSWRRPYLIGFFPKPDGHARHCGRGDLPRLWRGV
jgi:hypothetical protein